MNKQDLINQYKESFAKGHFNAKYLLFVLINGKLVFSKHFYDAKEAENLGFDMIKSSDWYNFMEDVKNIDYEVIDIESGERVSEPMGIIYLERDDEYSNQN